MLTVCPSNLTRNSTQSSVIQSNSSPTILRSPRILREQLRPVLNEIGDRYKAGETVVGFPTFYAYLESIGISPDKLRQWNYALRIYQEEEQIRLLVAGPCPLPENDFRRELWVTVSVAQRTEWAESHLEYLREKDLRERREEEEARVAAAEAMTRTEIQKQAKKTPAEIFAKKALEQKAKSAPLLGFLDKNSDKPEPLTYSVFVPDANARFFVHGESIDSVRKTMSERFGETLVSRDSRPFSDSISDIKKNAVRDLNCALTYLSSLQHNVTSFKSVRADLRKDNNFVGMSDKECDAALKTLSRLRDTINTITQELQGITFPKLTPKAGV